MWFFLLLKIVAIGVAAVASVKGRFTVGLFTVGGVLYLTAARGLSVLPPHINLPLSEWLEATWWSYPGLLTGTSIVATIVAFKAVNAAREGTSKHRHLERAAYSFLGNSLLDAGLLIILLLAHVLMATTEF